MQARRISAGADTAQRDRLRRCQDGRRAGAHPQRSKGDMLQQDQACSSGCAENTCCRFFVCARCRSQALVCSRCDRGQVYCGRHCALEARRCNQRKARARYQATSRGRKMHAERSRRYRAQHRRVTDQGSIPPGTPNLPDKPQTGIAAAARPAATIPSSLRTSCYYCGKHASGFVRLSAIRRPLPRSIEKPSGRPRRKR